LPTRNEDGFEMPMRGLPTNSQLSLKDTIEIASDLMLHRTRWILADACPKHAVAALLQKARPVRR
jgi:hypothetical protein